MEPTPTAHTIPEVFLQWSVADFVLNRRFTSSWQLFAQLEAIAHQGGEIQIVADMLGMEWQGAPAQMSADSVTALNLYLRLNGGLENWERTHPRAPRSRWAWVAFKNHLATKWEA